MRKNLMIFVVLLTVSSQAFAGWHYIDRVVQVTVQGDVFYVKGANASGEACSNHSGFYGTLYHTGTQTGHKEYYSMALMAQATEKGMACYIYSPNPQSPCLMENCYTY